MRLGLGCAPTMLIESTHADYSKLIEKYGQLDTRTTSSFTNEKIYCLGRDMVFATAMEFKMI